MLDWPVNLPVRNSQPVPGRAEPAGYNSGLGSICDGIQSENVIWFSKVWKPILAGF
jgi:hypothetical protein